MKNLKHGMSRTSFYSRWGCMKSRCENPNVKCFKHYGGRGIRIDWKDFLSFKADLFKSYLKHVKRFGEKDTTLERIDNSKGYSKENCRWATIKEQRSNNRRNHRIKGLTITQWSQKTGIPFDRIRRRLKLGWSEDEALDTKIYRNQFSLLEIEKKPSRGVKGKKN